MSSLAALPNQIPSFSDIDFQIGVVVRGISGSDRKIVKRFGGEICYVRRLKNGQWGNETRQVFVSTMMKWADHIVTEPIGSKTARRLHLMDSVVSSER